MKNLIILLTLFWVTIGSAKSQGPEPAQPWGLKLNLTSPLQKKLSLELERALSPKIGVFVRAGVLTDLFPSRPRKLEGYIFRVGPKFYLGKENMGLSLRPDLFYFHWRDWDSNIRGSFGNRWEQGFGGSVNVAYSLALGNILFVEPFAGISYLGVWERSLVPNDSYPYEVIDYDMAQLNKTLYRKNIPAHFNLTNGLGINAGILLGIRF